MKRQVTTGLLVLSVVLAVSAGVVVWQLRAPRYQGKPVHVWLQELDNEDFQARDRAAAALVALGPPAVPWLIDALQTRDNTLKIRLLAGLCKIAPLNLK